MLFITFWKLNNAVDIKKVSETAARLTKRGNFPLEGVKIISWLITPGKRNNYY